MAQLSISVYRASLLLYPLGGAKSVAAVTVRALHLLNSTVQVYTDVGVMGNSTILDSVLVGTLPSPPSSSMPVVRFHGLVSTGLAVRASRDLLPDTGNSSIGNGGEDLPHEWLKELYLTTPLIDLQQCILEVPSYISDMMAYLFF